MICKYLLPLEGCLFIFMMVPFTVQRLCGLIESHLFLLLSPLPLESDPQKISSRPMTVNLQPEFSSRSFMFSGLTFKSLIHFGLIFAYGVTEWSSLFVCDYPVFSTPFIEDTVLSRPCVLSFVIN